MRIIACMFLFVFVLLPQYVVANDGFGALGIGGVVLSKTDSIAIQKEVLDISCDNITVSYEFVNESRFDETATLMFPLPAYSANPPESGIIAHGQPHGFTIKVDGKPVAYRTEVKATNDRGQDVTSILKSIGLTDNQIAGFPFDERLIDSGHELHLAKQQMEMLYETGLVDDGTPLWKIHVTFVWNQKFQTKKVVHVQHSYSPFIAEGSAAGYSHERGVAWSLDKLTDGPMNEKYDFCLSKQQVARLDNLFARTKNRDNNSQLPGAVVEYILTTANSWKDGVRDFTLKVHTKSKDEVVAFCFPGGFRRVGEKLYEAHAKNFKPKSDLNIYFGNAHACGNSWYGEPPAILGGRL